MLQNTAEMHNQFCYESDIRIPAFCKKMYIPTHIPLPKYRSYISLFFYIFPSVMYPTHSHSWVLDFYHVA